MTQYDSKVIYKFATRLYSRAQILESILEPSKSIDPKYVTYLAETRDGQVHQGLLVEKTASTLVLRVGAAPSDSSARSVPEWTEETGRPW